jgi:hypothetical protein
MRHFLFFLSFVSFIGCRSDDLVTDEDTLDNLEAIAIGLLDESENIDCFAPGDSRDPDWECEFLGNRADHEWRGFRSGNNRLFAGLRFNGTDWDGMEVDGSGVFELPIGSNWVGFEGSLAIDGEVAYVLDMRVKEVSGTEIEVTGEVNHESFGFTLHSTARGQMDLKDDDQDCRTTELGIDCGD